MLGHARASPRGILRVDTSVALGRVVIAPALPQFQARFPELRVDLSINDQLTDPIAEGADVLVRVGGPRDSSLVARKLGTTHGVLVGSPSYFRKHGRPATVDDLRHLPGVGYLRHGRPEPWRLRGATGQPEDFTPLGSFHVNDCELLRDSAVAGRGLVWLWDFIVARELREGTLVEVLPGCRSEHRRIDALYPRSRHVSPRVRAFVDFLVELFSKGDWRPG